MNIFHHIYQTITLLSRYFLSSSLTFVALGLPFILNTCCTTKCTRLVSLSRPRRRTACLSSQGTLFESQRGCVGHSDIRCKCLVLRYMFSMRQIGFRICTCYLHITLFLAQELVKRAVAISYENGRARGTSRSKCIIVGMKVLYALGSQQSLSLKIFSPSPHTCKLHSPTCC